MGQNESTRGYAGFSPSHLPGFKTWGFFLFLAHSHLRRCSRKASWDSWEGRRRRYKPAICKPASSVGAMDQTERSAQGSSNPAQIPFSNLQSTSSSSNLENRVALWPSLRLFRVATCRPQLNSPVQPWKPLRRPRPRAMADKEGWRGAAKALDLSTRRTC